jgi:DNA (cytosine-5)-methyltransferase 1
MVQKKLKAIDLFCGAGGLSHGLMRAGLDVVGAVDFSASALKSYKRNFSHIALEADISKLSPAECLASTTFPGQRQT